MKKKPFDAVVKNHYQDKSLSENQLQQLESLIQTKTEVKQETFFQRYKITYLGVFLLLMTSLFFMINRPYTDLAMEIANEVTMNHQKLKPIEIASANLQTVSNYFTELDFSPIQTSLLDKQNTSLIGGRYCSIKGSTAAQLRYQNEDKKLITVFETPYDANKFQTLPHIEKGEQPLEVFTRGYKVNIWIEKGLVMASVETP